MKFCSTIAALLIAACLFVPSYSVHPKPGICPDAFNTLLPVPPCDNDTDCPGDDKCCKYGYGSVCAPPVTRSRRDLRKPGRCPENFDWGFGPLQPCRGDRDCPGAEKCCKFPPGFGCVPPDPPAPWCPPAGAKPCFKTCFDKCKNGQICCFNGCGFQCTTPPV